MEDLTEVSLPYSEPDIATILLFTSFILLLNVVNSVMDSLLYCGLLGQIFLGIAWGTPGGKWFSTDAERVIVQIGYLGLLVLVYEGGLSTQFKAFKANLLLSCGIAFTGVVTPIALSFSLLSLVNATPLQAFAAGAALCSTSLGTTLSILGTTGLATTRIGVVLTSAAMIDDVFGLILTQVISNLGSSSTSFNSITVVRPVSVSIGFAIVVPLIAVFIGKPLTIQLNSWRIAHPDSFFKVVFEKHQTAFLFHFTILIGLVISSTYAGTSNLFAAYIAGATVSWWDSEVQHPIPAGISSGGRSGLDIYKRYCQVPMDRILKPFFFASIGFSIPITRMFTSAIVWRGLVYTLLMLLGKAVCGLWLVRLDIPSISGLLFPRVLHRRLLELPHLWGRKRHLAERAASGKNKAIPHAETQTIKPITLELADRPLTSADAAAAQTPASKIKQASKRSTKSDHQQRRATPHPPRPQCLYPAAILGSAMVARGEIGFLISSLAQSNGLYAVSSSMTTGSEALFLVITWAIMLCTILGPLMVGAIVKRLKNLEVTKEGERDVLGVWSVNAGQSNLNESN